MRDGVVIVLVMSVIVVCFADYNELRFNISSKVPYYPQQDYTTYAQPPDGCVAAHMSHVARHGSREPTTSTINKLTNLQSSLQLHSKFISNPDFGWMATWVPRYDLDEAGYLTVTGEDEHYLTAKRMIAAYPEIFGKPSDPSRYPVRSTQVSRAGISANSFSYGMFEGLGVVGNCSYNPFFITAESDSLDYDLRFFDNCVTWIDDVDSNDDSTVEKRLYQNMVYPEIRNNFAAAMGVDLTLWNISDADIAGIWEACLAEFTVFNISDKFCVLIDNATLLDYFNYIKDLDYYWTRAYGYEINYLQASHLLQTLVNGIDQVIAKGGHDNNDEKAKLMFAHAETVLPFQSILGIFKDKEPLLHNSSKLFKQNRQFRATKLVPYAANVQLVLYNCSGGETFKVKLLVNEKETLIPGCEENLFCDWESFKNIYQEVLEIDYNLLCDIPSCDSSDDSDGDDDDDDSFFHFSTREGVMAIVITFVVGIAAGIAIFGVGLCCFHWLKVSKQTHHYESLIN
eukprot:CAMPEP_0174264182 /NCGR_PEP_ID=MMETSP0439-20130205/21601_1 /TAXON_ID=0 /ORGANISM="Stereomyxa ramosa, Strain Chinc5" /LENGTH=511 /DNA_ID=CAMNT_0015349935 /DNA_START=69 /DNA_END=1604 /DNA_ORIENTATION=-